MPLFVRIGKLHDEMFTQSKVAFCACPSIEGRLPPPTPTAHQFSLIMAILPWVLYTENLEQGADKPTVQGRIKLDVVTPVHGFSRRTLHNVQRTVGFSIHPNWCFLTGS